MRRFYIIFVLALGNLYVSLSLKQCEVDEDISHAVESQRLPNFVTPTYYSLSFVFDKDLTSYKATSMVEVIATESTRVIVLHADKFVIDSVDVSVLRTFKMDKGLRIPITEICYVSSAQFMVIRLEKYLKLSDMFNISFSFSGYLTSERKGISTYTYQKKDKTTKKVVATQFSDIMARTVFPCFDEPGFKARFDLEVSVPLPYQVVSNNRVSSKLILDNFVTYKFIQTPIMTTYSLAFVILDYDKISTLSKRETFIPLWIPDDYIEYGKFALDLAPKILDKYESLLKVNYPFQKLDIVCIPGFHDATKSFWGLIIFDIENLLFNDKFTHFLRKQEIVHRLAFSIAYQWFGCLVTPKWWNDIWLSSGLTTLVTHYALEEIYPEYKSGDMFNLGKLAAMDIDDFKFTHPISIKDNHKGKYFDINDCIAYYKGAAIPYMKLKLLEPEHFFRFLSTYLNNFAQSSVTTYQFFAALQMEESYDFIYDVGIHWTKTAGYPIVSIKRVSTKRVYEISQERILFTDDKTQKEEASKQMWQIPIKYVMNDAPTQVKFAILTNKTDEIKYTYPEKILKINIHADDFYITQYDKDMLKEITKVLLENIDIFSTKDKMGLIYDAITLLSYGKYDLETAFDLFDFLREETDYYVIRIYLQYLNDISTYIDMDDAAMRKFKRYLFEFTSSIVYNFDWQSARTDYTTKTYTIALLYSISYGNDDVTKTASKLFAKYLTKELSFSSDILIAYMCGYVRNEGKAGFDKILNMFLMCSDYTEKETYLYPLVCSNDTDSLKSLLKLLLTDSVPLQYKLTLLSYFQYSGKGYLLVMDFIYDAYEDLKTIFKETPYTITSVFPDVYGNMYTQEQLKKFTEFIDHHKIPKDIYVHLTIESIKKGISWTKRNVMDFIKYL